MSALEGKVYVYCRRMEWPGPVFGRETGEPIDTATYWLR